MQIEEIDYNEILEVRHAVLYPNMDIAYAKVDNDHLGIHVGIKEAGNAVAVVSIFLDGRNIQFRKLATLPSYQGKGYGSTLIKWIINYAKEMKFDKIWGNARLDALPFYQKLDFKNTEKEFSRNGIDYTIVEYNI